ncbi:MAG: hypothetical protein DDT31_00036 [Syntrophomonadaceae bacterium]|nr:hypothetical protein [Bacillota bacterium]
MTIKPPVAATFIFVDRRKTGRGKSLGNRQRLLDRIKDSIRHAKPGDIDSSGVAKGGASSSPKSLNNPVTIAREALHEPTYHYEPQTGEHEVVLIGNDIWERDDVFPISDGKGDGTGGPGQGGGEDEDDFEVHISRSEFFDVYFEDCELPDLKETSEKELPEAVLKPAGFQKEGNAAQLSIIRSYRNAIGRRRALTSESRSELEELESELKDLDNTLTSNPLDTDANTRMKEVLVRIEELRTKMTAVPLFEKVDLRYRKTVREQVKSAEAVLIMVMDVSGSMDEEKKRIARKFFTLQYAFIERKYPNTDLIFIIHTDTPKEVNEEEFFTTRQSGGTTVSPALKMALDIISARYDADQTNIYLSYAGDGDNWIPDNKNVLDVFEDQGLLTKLRHSVYLQVGTSYADSDPDLRGLQVTAGTNLWNTMVSLDKSNAKMHALKIITEDEVFSSFKKVYGKKKEAV